MQIPPGDMYLKRGAVVKQCAHETEAIWPNVAYCIYANLTKQLILQWPFKESIQYPSMLHWLLRMSRSSWINDFNLINSTLGYTFRYTHFLYIFCFTTKCQAKPKYTGTILKHDYRLHAQENILERCIIHHIISVYIIISGIEYTGHARRGSGQCALHLE